MSASNSDIYKCQVENEKMRKVCAEFGVRLDSASELMQKIESMAWEIVRLRNKKRR